MNNKERDEKFLKSWLKKKISITTSTVVSFLITGAVGGGTAYGVNANGSGNGNAVAVGTQSNSTAGGVAVGRKAQATGNEGAVAVGVESSTREYGVAIGYKAGQGNWTPGSASHSNITIGANTKVGDKGSTNSVGQSIAIGSSQGNGAWAKGTQAIAIGADTIAEGNSSIAIGGDDTDVAAKITKSYVKKSYDKDGTETSTAVNNQSLDDIYKDLTGRTEGLGYQSYPRTTAGEASVALGVKAIAGDIATALGTLSEATGINSLALGTGARATQVNSVAIGGGSTTEGLQGRKITDANMVLSDGTNVNFGNFAGATGVTEGGIVSFGRPGNERQLKNVAPGDISATSTDVTTGSQLYSVAKKLSEDINSKFRYVSIKSNDAGNKLNDGATANNAIAIGPNASTKVESTVSLGDGANIVAAPTIDKNGKLLQTVMSSGSGVAIGPNASASQAGVAIGDTSSTVTSGVAIGREAKVSNDYRENHGSYTKGQTQDGFFVYDRIQNNDNLKYSNTETTDSNAYSPGRYNGQGIAIGYKSDANTAGISLGNSATSKYGALALGNFAKAEGDTSTAIGIGAYASGDRAISMGRQASATTADSVAIGTGARGGASSAGGSVAVGGAAAATGTQAIAIGGLYGNDLYSSTATKDGAGNLTKNTQASGEASIAMGVNTKATGTKALAMGAEAQAKSEAALAVGVNAVSDKGIAIGKNSISRQDGSISLGLGASNNGGVAIGEAANAIVQSTDLTTANGLAFGKGSVAKGSVSIGDESYSDHLGVSIGYKAGNGNSNTGRSYNNITIGSYTKAGEAGKIVSQGIAIGSGTKEKEGAWAKGDQSIAIGSNTVAKGDSSIVIGGDDLDAVSLSRTSYTKKIFDKNGTQISTQNVNNQSLNDIYKNLTGRTEGLGYGVYNGTNSGQGAVALGVKAEAGDIALAIGTLAEAKGINSVAIGTGAQAPQANAVAIGGGSTTNGIQGRQVKDADITLADGTTTRYGNFAGATNVEEGSMVSFGRLGKERQLKNIAPGEISATSTDAINGSQLYSVAKTLGEGWKADAGGNKIGTSTLTSVKPGNTVVYSAGSNLQVKQTVDATNGKQTYEYSLNKDLTGLDSVTTKKITVPGTSGKNTVIDNNGINAGGNKITNVEPGTAGTDAVNKSQLDQKIGDNKIKLGGDNSSVTNEQVLSKTGGLQFNVVGTSGEIVTAASGDQIKVGLAQAVKDSINNKADKNLSNLTPAGNTVVKNLAQEAVEVVGTGAATVTKNTTTDKTTYTVNVDASKLSAGNSKLSYTANGAAPKKEVSLADGLNFTDGNLTTASVGANGVVTYNVTTASLTTTPAGKVTVPTTDGVATAKDVATAINNTGWKATAGVVSATEGTLEGTANSELVKSGNQVTFVAGKNLTVSQDVDTDGNHKYTYKLDKNLKDLESVTTKKITVPGTGGKDTVIDANGINAGGNTITNVGPGVNDKDAVNVSQLKTVRDNTIKLGGDKSTVTTAQNLSKGGGLKFNIKGANGLVTEANGTDVTVKLDSVTKQKIDKAVYPLKFQGNNYDPFDEVSTVLSKELGQTVEIVGEGAKADSEYSGESVKTIVENGKLVVKLDKTLKTDNLATNKVSVGKDGTNGKDAVSISGKDGKDGAIGINGKNGASADITVKNGDPVLSGTAADRIFYKDSHGNDYQVATMADGLKFSGDDVATSPNNTISKKLNEKLEIVGGVSDKTKLSNDNIGTIVDNTGKINVKLAKELTGLTSAEFKTAAGDKTVINGNGLTVTPSGTGAKDISITKDGISAGDKVIKDVSAGVNDKDAVNVSQLKEVRDNKIKLGGDNSSVTKEQVLSKSGGLQFNVVGTTDEIVTAASGDQVKVGLAQAVKDNIDSKANKDLSNITNAGKDVIKDTAAWKVKANNTTAETIKGGDEVVFKDGAGVTITQNGKEFTIAATDGKVTVPTTDGVATAKDVANAINNSGWKATAGGNVDGTPASTLVKSGDEVVFKAGDNLTVKQDLSAGKQEYTYKLNKDLTGLDSVTTKKITVPGTGGKDTVIDNNGINAGGNTIKNVGPGVNGTDAVNKDQLDATTTNLVNKGLNFKGNSGATVAKKLGETLDKV